MGLWMIQEINTSRYWGRETALCFILYLTANQMNIHGKKKDGFQDHDFTFSPQIPYYNKNIFLWLDIGKSTFRGSEMAGGRWGYIEDISCLCQTGLMSNPTLSSEPMK